jgi:hypothetical protein
MTIIIYIYYVAEDKLDSTVVSVQVHHPDEDGDQSDSTEQSDENKSNSANQSDENISNDDKVSSGDSGAGAGGIGSKQSNGGSDNGGKLDEQIANKLSKMTCEQVHKIFHAICQQHSNHSVTCVLQHIPKEFIHVSNVLSGARRHLFVLKGVDRKDLYWYEEYAAYLSRNKFYVSMSVMSNGDMLLSILMTRCNRPRCDLMIYSCQDGMVHIVKEADYIKANPGVTCDPDETIENKEKYEL